MVALASSTATGVYVPGTGTRRARETRSLDGALVRRPARDVMRAIPWEPGRSSDVPDLAPAWSASGPNPRAAAGEVFRSIPWTGRRAVDPARRERQHELSVQAVLSAIRWE